MIFGRAKIENQSHLRRALEELDVDGAPLVRRTATHARHKTSLR
jgi:hypothetical protein